MAILVCFRGKGPSLVGGTLSEEGQALSILPLLIRSPCHGKLLFPNWLWKGAQLGQALEQEVHPSPAHSDDPDKGLADSSAQGAAGIFWMWLFLGLTICV